MVILYGLIIRLTSLICISKSIFSDKYLSVIFSLFTEVSFVTSLKTLVFKELFCKNGIDQLQILLAFPGQRTAWPEWVLPTSGWFKVSWLLSTASYVSSILDASVPGVYLMNYDYTLLVLLTFLSVFSTHMLYLLYPCLSHVIGY